MTIGSLESASAIGQDWVGAPRPRPADPAQGLLDRQASQVRDTVEISSRGRTAGNDEGRVPAGRPIPKSASAGVPSPVRAVPAQVEPEVFQAQAELSENVDDPGVASQQEAPPQVIVPERGPAAAYARPVQISTRSWLA